MIWYCKDIYKIKYHSLFIEKKFEDELSGYDHIEFKEGTIKTITEWEKQNKIKLSTDTIPKGAKLFSLGDLKSQSGSGGEIIIDNVKYSTISGSWKTNQKGIDNLNKAKRISIVGSTPRYKRYFSDFPYLALNNMWSEQLSEQNKSYVVQTAERVILRCIFNDN